MVFEKAFERPHLKRVNLSSRSTCPCIIILSDPSSKFSPPGQRPPIPSRRLFINFSHLLKQNKKTINEKSKILLMSFSSRCALCSDWRAPKTRSRCDSKLIFDILKNIVKGTLVNVLGAATKLLSESAGVYADRFLCLRRWRVLRIRMESGTNLLKTNESGSNVFKTSCMDKNSSGL